MKILVSGSSGYLGGRLSRYLLMRGIDVICGVRKSKNFKKELLESNTVEINWNDFKELTDICLNVDVVIHTAGMNARDCENNPKDAMLFNGSRTGDFIRASKKAGVKKFIYLSTVHVYSPELTGFITEQSIAKNKHPYTYSNLIEKEVLRETSIVRRLMELFYGSLMPLVHL